MDKTITVSASAFGKSDACTMRRGFLLDLGTTKGTSFQKAVAITDAVRDALTGKV